ncbi:MAG TPA: hypothetical protein VK763_07955 [Terriglobales bacterium]|jgi:hypothetical protein|nr:hypothetical protein [Terriglobales bacterium]
MSSAPRFPKTLKISDSLTRQLNTYAQVASAAGVSVLALAGASEAKVVYTETYQVTHTGFPLYIDLNHDGIKDFLVRTTFYVGSSGSEIGLAASGYRNINNVVAGRRFSRSGYFSSAAFALRAGARIGPEGNFSVRFPFMAEELFNGVGSQYSALGAWVGTGKGVKDRYLGLKFVIRDEVHYGWARLSVRLGHHRQFDDVSGTLTGYAYETVPNEPIIAGQITGPDVITVQPETLGGLALGRK